jgi:hypothetical protein
MYRSTCEVAKSHNMTMIHQDPTLRVPNLYTQATSNGRNTTCIPPTQIQHQTTMQPTVHQQPRSCRPNKLTSMSPMRKYQGKEGTLTASPDYRVLRVHRRSSMGTRSDYRKDPCSPENAAVSNGVLTQVAQQSRPSSIF